MAQTEDLFSNRKSLDEICTVPDKIISVYSLEQHVWADSNSPAARQTRQPELQTLQEFQIDPVRSFLNDVLRQMAAPYRPERKENPIGQGYWIQAEFGSGKSHLLCFLAALALGNQAAWDIIQEKEKKAGRGKRESLYSFWEEGLKAKAEAGKGIFVIVKTLVGVGGGTVGLTDKGQRLTEYILDAARAQLQLELGKNLSLYPAELLADRFIQQDLDLYYPRLKKFLRDPRFFEEDEFEEIDDFIRDIQQNKSPEYKRSCGNKLWRFYTEDLQVNPNIHAETRAILKHLVETILAEGYSGVLLVLDEVSLFMKNRSEDQRTDDEQTLVVLANQLAKGDNLPLWTVCAAQQAIESKMGVKNIIANDRLKLVELLKDDQDYYDIVLARVREIKDPGAISNYYLHYKRGFTWPNSIGEAEFSHFFPFHKPALEVLRAITYELTTARSAIHFMHQTLKHQVKQQGRELIRLWELFDEAVRYEEEPSGVHAGLVAIKTKRELEYRAYEAGKRQLDSLTKGYLKVYRDRAVKTLQTLFLYHLAKTRQQGLPPEEIANSVLIERDDKASPDENIQHYENLTENLKKELRQIVQNFDEDKRPRYRFDPVFTGVDPREEFRKARDEAEANEVMQQEAWEHLLGLDEWLVRTRKMTLDLSNGVESMFNQIATSTAGNKGRSDQFWSQASDQEIEVTWQGRQVTGLVGMRDLARIAADNQPLPNIDSDQTDRDFAVFISSKPVSAQAVSKLIAQRKDRRVMFWSPAERTTEERDRLLDFAAYRKLVSTWEGKDTEDAMAVINWVSNSLQADMAKIAKIVDNSYGRGRIDALDNTQMEFHVAGELASILAPLVERVLAAAYESQDLKFDPPFIFRKEEAVKVINGLVKTGAIPKGVKPNQNTSAAQNFGPGLKIVKKGADKELDVSDNPYVQAMWTFVDEKLGDGQSMRVDTLYKNFMGIGGPKDYGLTRRMVQLYLLCLARLGKVRITIAPKSGLAVTTIDYSNLADIEFSAKVLDALIDVQKMAKPANWEVLRPYAAKLLNKELPTTQDDAVISGYRAELRQLFSAEKEASSRARDRAKSLFDLLGVANPYEQELKQVADLFATDIAGGDDIALLLYGLKESLGYRAFDDEEVSPAEVDDLANRLKNYRDVSYFLGFETDIRTAVAYVNYALPDLPELKAVRQAQQDLGRKLAALQPYIDSDVRLKTELIGHTPAEPGEVGTIGALRREYTTVYSALHDNVMDALEKDNQAIQTILAGEAMQALQIMENISALKAPVSAALEQQLTGLAAGIFTCSDSSRTSIEKQLLTGPVHDCKLSFSNAETHLQAAQSAVDQARQLFDDILNRKLEVFLNVTVRDRLKQGTAEAIIEALLACQTVAEVRACLVPACLADPALVDVINRYLKQITVKSVKLADFKPTVTMLEREQIPQLVREFQQYLEAQLPESAGAGDDILPMLQVE